MFSGIEPPDYALRSVSSLFEIIGSRGGLTFSSRVPESIFTVFSGKYVQQNIDLLQPSARNSPALLFFGRLARSAFFSGV